MKVLVDQNRNRKKTVMQQLFTYQISTKNSLLTPETNKKTRRKKKIHKQPVLSTSAGAMPASSADPDTPSLPHSAALAPPPTPAA
jgi:hypothetical protein